ncbi:MAG: alpha/beta fold hydrolase [Mycobacteriales bacterium]
MTGERLTVTAADGRTLPALVAGPVDGLPLVVHHGTPSGLALYPPWVEAANTRGLRTVMVARPGYGDATPQPGRAVAAAAGDVAAVLDALGAAEFVTLGWSGGGPHALACAALLTDRCLAAASVAGVAPYPAEGLDWLGQMGLENIAELDAALTGEAALTTFLEAAATEVSAVTATRVSAELGGLVSEVDQKMISGAFAEFFAEALRTSVDSGIAGWRDDDLAFVTDWGFGLDGIGPVAIWHGLHDRMAPYPHGEWLAEHVPGARAHLLSDEGHLTLVAGDTGRILDDLLDLAGKRR